MKPVFLMSGDKDISSYEI